MPETPEQMIARVRKLADLWTLETLDRAALRYVLKQAESARQLAEALDAADLTYPCPNAGDPDYSVDYGIGHGHICDFCHGTGQVEIDGAATVRAALAAWKARAGE